MRTTNKVLHIDIDGNQFKKNSLNVVVWIGVNYKLFYV